LFNSPDVHEAHAPPCRLCGGGTALAFHKMLLGKHRVGFYYCTQCESLQTEQPYWLAEAYSSAVDAIDTGAAQRVLHCVALTHSVMRLLACRTALDFGGGSGLLCRLLRDAGHDAYWYDQYSSPGYATGFAGAPANAYDLVTSFEVIEHFPNPQRDLQELFSGNPGAVLLMTEIYTGQDEDWTYLAPEEGQHIFFYSPKALAMIGARLGYHLLICRGFILFLHAPPAAYQRWILQKLLRPRILGWIKLILLAGSGQGAIRDYEILSARVSQRHDGQIK
jgi:hypothetical protein